MGNVMEGTDGWSRTCRLGEVTKEMNGKPVTVMGFVREIRDVGKLKFVLLADITGTMQVTFKEGTKAFNAVSDITRESAIGVKGTVSAGGRAASGIEIIPDEIKVFSRAEPKLPIQVYGKTDALLDTRMDWRFLDIRKPKNALIFKVQTTIEAAMREYWIKQGFIEIHSPKLMGAPSESGAELFPVIYFDKTAFLAQSPQFYKQMAICAGLDRVFEIGPVFRAEPSNTTRHATEFTSVDMEMAWIESHEDIMKFEEEWIVHVMGRVKEEHGDEIKDLYGLEVNIPSTPFPRISFREAKDVLKQSGKGSKEENDISSEEEKAIGEMAMEKYGSEFIFVKEYPWSIKPFYHMRKEDDPSVTKGYDLLYKGLEVTTGSQREHRYDILMKQAKEKGLSEDNVGFYTDFFRYGAPPHGGFGFGLSRLVKQMLNIENIREAMFAFRDMKRLFP